MNSTTPIGIAVNLAGTRAYVANNSDSTVSVIDTATNTVVGAPIAVGFGPFAFGQFIGPAPAAASEIPTLSAWGMLLLALLLGALGAASMAMAAQLSDLR